MPLSCNIGFGNKDSSNTNINSYTTVMAIFPRCGMIMDTADSPTTSLPNSSLNIPTFAPMERVRWRCAISCKTVQPTRTRECQSGPQTHYVLSEKVFYPLESLQLTA